jgi:hypothetical protein
MNLDEIVPPKLFRLAWSESNRKKFGLRANSQRRSQGNWSSCKPHQILESKFYDPLTNPICIWVCPLEPDQTAIVRNEDITRMNRGGRPGNQGWNQAITRQTAVHRNRDLPRERASSHRMDRTMLVQPDRLKITLCAPNHPM